LENVGGSGASQADSDDDRQGGESSHFEEEDDADVPQIFQWVDNEMPGEGSAGEGRTRMGRKYHYIIHMRYL